MPGGVEHSTTIKLISIFLFKNKILHVSGHKNTKLFITHSGLLSTQESVYHGVPMLGIPIFADQFIVSASSFNNQCQMKI